MLNIGEDLYEVYFCSEDTYKAIKIWSDIARDYTMGWELSYTICCCLTHHLWAELCPLKRYVELISPSNLWKWSYLEIGSLQMESSKDEIILNGGGP